ncbi:hypothetical protein DBV15_08727 [Temnothorax longispinosus]|uniref:Uncharacterized protein n=1 Tax=Temnothorax longispinosus TaxID=300112 RepID=A0A4S2KUK7_9HYME|nr:hypothetical protein DBV15_08727 [Temnothorax longispinosus]
MIDSIESSARIGNAVLWQGFAEAYKFNEKSVVLCSQRFLHSADMFSMISLYESCIFPLWKPIIYPTSRHPERFATRGPLESVAQFPAGSGRNRFRRLTRAMGISTNSSAVFHWLLPASAASAAAAAVLMEGWELTPRGLPVLLSLFMSDDIATLSLPPSFANPKSAAVFPFLTFGCSRSNFGFQSRGKWLWMN